MVDGRAVMPGWQHPMPRGEGRHSSTNDFQTTVSFADATESDFLKLDTRYIYTWYLSLGTYVVGIIYRVVGMEFPCRSGRKCLPLPHQGWPPAGRRDGG